MKSTSGAGPKPCFVNKVLLEHSRVQLVYILPVAATETLWPVKPQIIRNWSFSKEVCWSLLYLKLSMLQAVLKIRSKYTLKKGIIFPRQRAERNFCRLPQQGDNAENSFLNSVLDRFPLIPRAAADDGQYLYTYWRNFLEGERNTTLVQSVSLLWLNPKIRSKWIKGNSSDSLQPERIAYLLSARPYSTFHTWINMFILTEILFKVSTVFYPHFSEGKTETVSSKDKPLINGLAGIWTEKISLGRPRSSQKMSIPLVIICEDQSSHKPMNDTVSGWAACLGLAEWEVWVQFSDQVYIHSLARGEAVVNKQPSHPRTWEVDGIPSKTDQIIQLSHRQKVETHLWNPGKFTSLSKNPFLCG